MNKPLTMIIKETKANLAKVCNESGLSPVILDLIVQGIYSEIHSIAEKQAFDEEFVYFETIKNKDTEECNLKFEGDANESK